MNSPRRPLGTRTPASPEPSDAPVRPRRLVAERIELALAAGHEHVVEQRPYVRGRRPLGLGGAVTPDES